MASKPPPAASIKSAGNSAPRFAAPAFLLPLFALLIALARLHTYSEPTDRDMACYAVEAHEVLMGGRLYSGVLLDQKPPAVAATYGLAEMVAGYGRGQIYLLGVTAAVLTLFACYFAVKALTGNNTTAALWAAAFWTVTCSHLRLEANQPNSEVFINMWNVLGIALMAGAARRLAPWQQAALSGCCFALASLYKHSIVVVPFFVGIGYILCPRPGRARSGALLDVAIIGAVGVVAWAAVFAYFGITGRIRGFVDCLFVYNQYYSGDKGANLSAALRPELLFPAALHGLAALAIFALGGAILGLVRREKFPWAMLVGLAMGTELAVALPGRFYPHYYQLWFPFLILTAGCAADVLSRWESLPNEVRRGFAPVVLLILIGVELPSFFLTPEEWSRMKYGDIFVASKRLSQLIDRVLLKDETFYQLGSETQLYFDTKRRPPSAMVDYGLLAGPLVASLAQQVVSDLQKAPPDLFILEKWTVAKLHPNHPVMEWFRANYDQAPTGANQDPFYLFVRKGSALQQRWQNGQLR